MRRWSEVLTVRGRAFLAAGLTLLLGGLGLGFADLTRVGVLLVGLPLVSAAMARRRPPGVWVDRVATPMQVTVGEPVSVSVRVGNAGSRATPLMMAEEQLGEGLQARPRFVLGTLGAGEERSVAYAVHPGVRGRHRLGPLAVQLRDPFGLTTRHVDLGPTDDLLVLPRTYPLGGNRPPGTGVGAEGEVPHMVALHGEDDQSVREYRDGDELRRVHWPATARTGTLMVRQEDRPARRRVVVLLDSRATAHRGAGADASFEWAVSAAASVVLHLSALGYAVHLLGDETVTDGHTDASTEPDAILEALAVARTGPDARFVEVTRAAQPLMATGGLLVAVVVAHDQEVARRVAALRQPGGTAWAFLLDRGSFEASHHRGPSESAAMAELFRDAGWTVVVVEAGRSITQAWADAAHGPGLASVAEGVPG